MCVLVSFVVGVGVCVFGFLYVVGVNFACFVFFRGFYVNVWFVSFFFGGGLYLFFECVVCVMNKVKM